MRPFTVLLLAIAVAGAGLRGADERGLPLVRNFSPQTIGGTNQVWDGVRAPDGTLLFGSFGRVLAYDGQNWRRIPVPGGAHIRGIGVDRLGTVWVGGVNELGRIDRGPDGGWTFKSLRDAVPKEAGDLGTIWQVHVTDEGVWFQANGATLRWRDGRFDHWNTGDRSIVLSFWLGDHLAVCTTRGWLKPVDGGKWETLGRPEDRLADYLPHFAVPHPRGGWLMGLEGPKGEVLGLARWDGKKLSFEPHPLDSYFKSKRLYGGRRLADGRYVFTTLQGGAVVLDEGLNFQTLLNEESGLDSSAVISVTEDGFDGVWLGTEWGLSRVDLHPAYTWFGAANGWKRHSSPAILRWHDRLLFSGHSGLLQLQPPAAAPGWARFVRWSEIDEKIWALTPAGDSLLVGALGGIWEMDAAGQVRKVTSFTNNFSIVVSARSPGTAYSASLNGLARLERREGSWTLGPVAREVRGNTVVEDAAGNLWVGTDNQGVWRVRFEGREGKPPSAERFGRRAGLPVDDGKVEVMDVGGKPLFLTTRGLMRFDDTAQQFRPEPAFGGMLADGSTTVRAMEPDRAGGWWMILEPSGPADLAIVPRLAYQKDGHWQYLPLPEPDRVGGNRSLHLDHLGGREILWVLGQSAVLRVDLTAWREHPVRHPGATLLSEVTIGDGTRLPLDRRAPWRVPPGLGTMRFTVAAPGLGGEATAVYETKLHGFADGAAEQDARGERTFTNLPPGNYEFEARGRTADGRWTEPVRVPFTVLAPWWQTTWAAAGYLVLGSLALFAYVRWRIRRLTRERRRLEAVIVERTAELARKNVELERLHRLDQDEKLAARLAEEKAQLELLRYQLNPHFLYNALNSIRALVFTNAESAAEMVTRISEFCRATLTRTADGMTTVAEEVEMLQAYLDIERTRWQESLRARIDVQPETRQEQIPQFLFLPLMENAIKYGGRTSPDLLEITMTVRFEDDMLVCQVANTGQWLRESEPNPESTRIGLDNLRQRLARYYGPQCHPEVVTMPGWVCVRLNLPRAGVKRPAATP